MTFKSRGVVDKVWLGWFILQIIVTPLIDGLPFYPKWLYATPDSPLYFLQRIHELYVTTYRDLIVTEWHSPVPVRPWVRLCTYIEMAFQLPTSLYAVLRLRKGRGTSGGDELLLLVYAFNVFFSTLLCAHDVYHWDEKLYTMAEKHFIVGGIYGSWMLIPFAMFVDMYLRLYARVSTSDIAKKTK
ncbi:hypothetical protein MCOR02_009987 [Pyricularia oryzae]|nr:hypothetical protein MCOR01_001197 [Pyricularia oryzae]KAH9430268.1 hypothetical protein MCOR02_009987 [Pyricularia oryzae]KAI6376366.1 hypothetical protein MCOR32_005090 [Pyricularia oryzae]KAI6376920.1 hypothetical protein MCOR31_001373 [Pyricularia oryzae]KAI6420770.1 hypothetical protein MCOR24_004590 [Pyricularia oryzae]